MYNTTTLEVLQIVQQIKADLNEHYQDHKTQPDEYLLSKANLESDAGEEIKAKAVRYIKKKEHRNQIYRDFWFYQGTVISAQGINQLQVPRS